MRIVRHPLTTGFAVLTAFFLAQGCGKKDSKNDDDKTEKSDEDDKSGDGTPSDDAALKDDYQGIYQVQSQVETPFGSCDETKAKAVDGIDKLAFFKLDTSYEYSADPTSGAKIDLWLYKCTDAATCEGQVVNFLFPDKTDGVWGGQTSLSIGNSPFEPGKCSFGYTERSAKLTGKDIVITTTSYSGDVAPLGGGCMSADGGSDLETYYSTYRGKIACDGLTTIKALKLDVPMPE